MKKALYFDVETTGLNPWRNDIIQLACLVEINGEIKEEFETKIRPFDFDNIDQKALDIHGYKVEQLREFPHPMEVHKKLTDLLGKYVNKFDKSDKFAPAGYNVRFDADFLQNFFKKNDDKYYGSWFNWRYIDPMYTLYMMDYERRLALPDYKLQTVCTHLGIGIDAHDALSDIRATRQLVGMLQDGL